MKRAPLAVLALAVAASLAGGLAGCTSKHAATPGLGLAEPSAVAAFRGFTTKTAELHPYLAIANAASNDLTLVDAVDDSLVPAPVPLRAQVVPVPGRPALLASAQLAEASAGPDLLVAVSAGSSALQVIRTWSSALGVACGGAGEPACVDLGGDVVDVVAVPTPALSGTARLAAALSGGRVAVVTFGRGSGGAIDVAGATVQVSAPLGFQPVALAALPGDTGRIFAATPDLDGVAQIDVSGVPAAGPVLSAGAPTRLVAAARLAERGSGEAGLDPLGWATTAPVARVYAVLDESGCGIDEAIACGLVALDPGGGGLAPDFVNPASPRAPIAVPGRALALGASGPPAFPPSTDPADQKYARPFMRIGTALEARVTTGAAAVASTDGAVYFVDLGRWELPSDQLVRTHVAAAKVTAARAPTTGVPVDQWLVLDPDGPGPAGPVPHLDPASLATAVTVTPGFTPTVRWTVTHEGILPGLSSRRAQAGYDGTPWLALQTGSTGAFFEVVRLYDPTLGVRPGDTVVIEPTGLASCTAVFEVTVADLVKPAAATYPGGAVRLTEKDAGNAAWHACFDALTGPVTGLRATFRAGGAAPYVLVRGTGAAAIHAGRPALAATFSVAAADEASFPTCVLPPAAAWPSDNPDAVPLCDATCRADCEGLLRARLARRVGYIPEPGGVDPVGPAIAFAIALETGAPAPRDLAVEIDTVEGRIPSRRIDALGAGVDARAVVPFDRTPYARSGGLRFLVPFTSGVVLDASPTVHGSVSALR